MDLSLCFNQKELTYKIASLLYCFPAGHLTETKTKITSEQSSQLSTSGTKPYTIKPRFCFISGFIVATTDLGSKL